MVPIKEALTFDDVTLAPKYSEVLPSDVDTSICLLYTSPSPRDVEESLILDSL